jgi:plastocyanin
MKGTLWLCLGLLALAGCSTSGNKTAKKIPEGSEKPAYYTINPSTAGVITGVIRFNGRKPRLKPIDMSSDPACVEAHDGKAYEESLVVGKKGALANVFVYIKKGLEGKRFETPAQPETVDQSGCWFRPRVLGIQVGQILKVVNSDPVTHNIHPLAHINREWNHSQGAGDPPISRRFLKPEIMIPVKCNIHSWMHAYIGVLDHPYFAVSGKDGTFEIRNVPPGDYVIEAWQEKLGTQDQKIAITPSGKVETAFNFKGE